MILSPELISCLPRVLAEWTHSLGGMGRSSYWCECVCVGGGGGGGGGGNRKVMNR